MASKLSPQQLQQFREAFKLLDSDGDGRITAKQLYSIMKQFDYATSEQDIDVIIKQIDTDNNGTIELHQFLNFISTKASEQKDQESDLKKVFKLFDKDNNGLITKEELKQGLNSLGEKMSDKDIQQLVEQADLDGDGYINYQEFVELTKFK